MAATAANTTCSSLARPSIRALSASRRLTPQSLPASYETPGKCRASSKEPAACLRISCASVKVLWRFGSQTCLWWNSGSCVEVVAGCCCTNLSRPLRYSNSFGHPGAPATGYVCFEPRPRCPSRKWLSAAAGRRAEAAALTLTGSLELLSAYCLAFAV